MMTHTDPAPRRRRWVTRALMLALIGAAALAAIFAGQWLTLSQDAKDARAINAERVRRYALALARTELPGQPDLARLQERLAAAKLAVGAPVLIRIFKREFELELWMARDGAFHLFATYPICMWSGALGPKIKTGDGQAPEGFYSVSKEQLNPNSKYYRSFNLGFPNAYDRAFGRTGSFLMVHGACASVGCYAMTDAQIGEIWTLVTAALGAGQPAFQVQAYPFRMSKENLEAYAGHPHAAFWRDLALGNDMFEQNFLPPEVDMCNGRYAFQPGKTVQSGAAGSSGRCAQASAN